MTTPLPKQQWRRVEELFTQAAELQPTERSEFLTGASCEDDPLVRVMVEELLAADQSKIDVVADAVAAAATAVGQQALAAQLGRRIGPYRLVERLGQGGMGEVYVARRADDQYEATVAIKLLHAGPTNELIRERLRRERQILAQLDHPNIARLYDGGTADDGTIYFVMEYIAGEPILAFAERRRLDRRARIGLFLDLCAAVDYAHRNLVVHQDIKPGNVLVTEAGVTKLLDFGVAKLVESTEAEGSPRVAGSESVLMLTPAYASPERLLGRPASTSTDIYSMGVLLYELIHGRRPYQLDESFSSATLANELLARVDDPPRTDLDAIAQRAFARDLTQRYASITDLAADLRCYLGGFPVQACAPTLWYRTRRFVARRRLAVGFGAAAMGVAIALGQVVHLNAQRAAVQQQRADRVAKLLAATFDVAAPGSGMQLTVKDLLDHGAERAASLVDEPETQALLLEKLATLYEKAGHLQRATELFSELVAIQQRLAPASTDLARAQYSLGRSFARRGDYSQAASLFRRSLELRERLLGPNAAEVARNLSALALTLQEVGQFVEAESLYRNALRRESLHAPEHREVAAMVQGNFALLLLDTGRFSESERLFRDTLGLVESAPESSNADQIEELRGGLCLALIARHALPEAITILRAVYAERRQRFGDDHYLVARTATHLGIALVLAGQVDEGGRLIERAAEVRLARLGTDHMEHGESCYALGLWQMALAHWKVADQQFLAAAETYRKSLGASHPRVAESLLELGKARAQQGRFTDACAQLAAAATIFASSDERHGLVVTEQHRLHCAGPAATSGGHG